MNQNKLRLQNLDKMCCMLMKDIGESYAIPADLKGKQQMLRGLMNLRYPIAMNADFLTLQDKELQMQRKEKGGTNHSRWRAYPGAMCPTGFVLS